MARRNSGCSGSLRVGECVDNRQSLILAIVGETDSSANGYPVFLAELTSNRWGPGGGGGGGGRGTITNLGRV